MANNNFNDKSVMRACSTRNKGIYTIIGDRLAEFASMISFGVVSVELTIDKQRIAKVKFNTEVKDMQFLDINKLDENGFLHS